MFKSDVTKRIAFAVLAFVGAVSGAAAEQGSATTWLNIRSGPGASYAVVDNLAPGEVVDITECQASGWCYVTHDGPDGWVSSTYLTMAPGAPGAGGPDCRLVISVGPDGPRFGFVCGTGGLPGPGPGPWPEPWPEPGPGAKQACFYTGTNYTGAKFCSGLGTMNTLNATFRDQISSVRLKGGARARLCVDANLGGFCRNVTDDTPVLGPLINNRASSLAVYSGTWAGGGGGAPVTFSTGLVNLPLDGRVNLDTGVVGGAGADLRYVPGPGISRRIELRNGALAYVGDGSNRGYDGCRIAPVSGGHIPVAALPPGTYVCVRTSEGRVAQFRVNSYTATLMRLGYTTWAD